MLVFLLLKHEKKQQSLEVTVFSGFEEAFMIVKDVANGGGLSSIDSDEEFVGDINENLIVGDVLGSC